MVDDGNIGVRLLEAPSNRADDPRARSYIIDHLAPGTTIERSFEVSNGTGQSRLIELYPGPADVTDGQFIGADAGARSELTTWTTVAPTEVRLGPGESAEVEASISVPDDASLGERYAVLWASTASLGQSQVRTINRVGIRIYLSVGPGGEPASEFEINSLTPGRTDKGRPYVQATVTNTGGRAIDLRGKLRLGDGPGGLKAGPFDLSTGTLAPGDQEKLPVLLDKSLPAGPWQARLVLRSGLLEERATAEVTFPEEGAGQAVAAEEDTPWWQSWPFLVGLALLVLLLALLLRLLRRGRRRPEEDRSPEPELVSAS